MGTLPDCEGRASSPPWTGIRSLLFAVGGAISSGGVVFSLLSAMLGASLSRSLSYLTLSLGIGIILLALSTARVYLEDSYILVKGRLLPTERYQLSSLVEFIDLTSVKWFVALRRIPGLLMSTASNLMATTAAFLWAYLKALPPTLAVIGAVLSGICFVSLEISVLISPSLGRNQLDNRFIGISSLATLIMGISVLVQGFPGDSLERMAAAGSMTGVGLAGMINALLSRSSTWGRVFRLRFSGGRLIYVSLPSLDDAISFKRTVMEAIKNAETS